jgi:hypothetical protein
MNEQTITTIEETGLTLEQKAVLGKRQWLHEATRDVDSARLYTSVTYNHSTRGTWKAALVHPDGRIEKLVRVPVVGKAWALTVYGAQIRFEGRNS